jgi:uncharacterized membrane protein
MTQDALGSVYERAISHMSQKGWQRLTAKSRGFEQSLFDHTRIEIDALLQLAPIFSRPNHFGLTKEEIELLVVALMAHDVGKQLPEWQDYILGRGEALSDVNRKLTAEVVPTLYPALGLEPNPDAELVIENCINLHMRHERRSGNVLDAILGARESQTRWFTLAEIVFHLDNLCSIGSVSGALAYLRNEKHIFYKHFRSSHHQVNVRGVSTPMLHRAAEDAFDEKGWTPLLYFRDATIYVKSAAESKEEPAQEDIRRRLSQVLQENLQGEVASLMVGSPTAAILPKPDLFDHRELGDYLRIAYRKIGSRSFAKKKSDDRRRVVADYLNVKQSELDKATLERETERISQAQPEMIVFKFFKAATSESLIGSTGFRRTIELYDEIFGEGSRSNLQKTANLMPAKEMRSVIDPFWTLSGSAFDQPVEILEELDAATRLEILLKALEKIARQVYSEMEDPPSRAALADDMSKSFIADLVAPTPLPNFVEVAKLQREYYSISKKFAGKKGKKARYFCPVCNTPFETGTQARADFVDKPEAHTNRATAYGGFDKVFICNACKYERLLRQVLLGDRTQEVMVLMPRMNIGRAAGVELVRRARNIYNELYVVMVGETDDPDVQVSVSLTGMIASKGMDKNVFQLSDEELSRLFSYRAGEKNRRKHRNQLAKSLKEEFEDLEDLNEEWGADFEDWDSVLDAVIAGEVTEEPAPELRREAYNLGLRMKLICQTPNLILVPLSYSLSVGSDNETNSALRKLFVELIVGLSLDCAVAILRDSESFALPEPQGVAWIPPTGPARRLVGEMLERFERKQRAGSHRQKQMDRLVNSEWVPLEYGERVYRAIGAASMLAGDTNYSDRSHIYQVLSAPTVGHVLRRIEQESSTGQVPFYHLKPLRTLEEVLA